MEQEKRLEQLILPEYEDRVAVRRLAMAGFISGLTHFITGAGEGYMVGDYTRAGYGWNTMRNSTRLFIDTFSERS